MKKLSISINILQLQGACRATIKGEDCIVICVAKSRVNAHRNGKVYLNLEAVGNRDGVDQYENTHFVAEPTTKDERESGVKLPIIGNGKEWTNENTSYQKPAEARTTRNIPRAQPQNDEDFGGYDSSEIPF